MRWPLGCAKDFLTGKHKQHRVAKTSGMQALACVLYHRTVLHTFAESGVCSCQCDFLALQTSFFAESMFNYLSAVCSQVVLTDLTCWILHLQYAQLSH